MPLRFLADEHLRGRLREATSRHNAQGGPPIDLTQVGASPELPLGAHDSDILIWAEREERILITLDVHTIPSFLEKHLAFGRHSPGVFLVRRGVTTAGIVSTLVLIAHASEPHEWRDRCQFIPFD